MRVLSLVATLFLVGCATQPSYPVYQPTGSPSPSAQSSFGAQQRHRAGATAHPTVPDQTPCQLVVGHTDSSGRYISSYYHCPENSVYTTNSANSCSWVAAYTRQDGTAVQGHNRCARNELPHSYRPSAASYQRSCVTSYCGPVRVRGYYRKDGTYVRPHTRRRSR
jgi:hypothetical protein